MPRIDTVGLEQICVAIDDIGIGHTSLHYLKEFPVYSGNIHRCFTQEYADDVNDHIIASIVQATNTDLENPWRICTYE